MAGHLRIELGALLSYTGPTSGNHVSGHAEFFIDRLIPPGQWSAAPAADRTYAVVFQHLDGQTWIGEGTYVASELSPPPRWVWTWSLTYGHVVTTPRVVLDVSGVHVFDGDIQIATTGSTAQRGWCYAISAAAWSGCDSGVYAPAIASWATVRGDTQVATHAYDVSRPGGLDAPGSGRLAAEEWRCQVAWRMALGRGLITDASGRQVLARPRFDITAGTAAYRGTDLYARYGRGDEWALVHEAAEPNWDVTGAPQQVPAAVAIEGDWLVSADLGTTWTYAGAFSKLLELWPGAMSRRTTICDFVVDPVTGAGLALLYSDGTVSVMRPPDGGLVTVATGVYSQSSLPQPDPLLVRQPDGTWRIICPALGVVREWVSSTLDGSGTWSSADRPVTWSGYDGDLVLTNAATGADGILAVAGYAVGAGAQCVLWTTGDTWHLATVAEGAAAAAPYVLQAEDGTWEAGWLEDVWQRRVADTPAGPWRAL